MTKRLIILFLALGLMTHQLTGCSSSDSKDDGSAAASNDDSFSDESNGDFASDDSAKEGEKSADAEKPPEDEGKDIAASDDSAKAADGAAKDGAKDELSLDDEGLPEDVAANSGDPAAAPPPAAPETPAAPPAEAPVEQQASQQPATPPTDDGVFKDQTPQVAAAPAPAPAPETPAPVADAAPVAPKVFAPLQKIKSEPYSKNGANINRVYLVRDGDGTLKAVSQKLYGKNRTKDLKAWNPGIHNSVKAGDKVYYESPKDPADTHMLTYYEDIGQAPSIYTSKDGDNIRKVSKDLIGGSNSWKEVWATNPSVESKGDIPAGLQIKYWGDTPAAPGGGESIAKNGAPPAGKAPGAPGDLDVPPDMQPPPPPGPSAPPTAAMNDTMPAPPPPPPDMNTPPGGAAAGAAAGTMANNMAPPPPPPSQEMAPPPPPPPPEPKPVAKKAPAAAVDSGSDPDTMMAIGFGGILLIAAAALFVVIRKNRAKRVDLSQTQV
jgi:hypothetical protein